MSQVSHLSKKEQNVTATEEFARKGNFSFIGDLNPIKNPATERPDGDCRQEYLDYGFLSEVGTTSLGSEFGLSITIYGPSKEGTPYEWMVVCVVNGHGYNVWCKTFVELQRYLVRIAPLLSLGVFR